MRKTAPVMGDAGSMPAGGMAVAVSRGGLKEDDKEAAIMPKAIGIEREDGAIDAIYIHADGLTESVIDLAMRCYQTAAAVSALVALGDLSKLGRYVGEQNDFDSGLVEFTTPEWCLAYHRDRGEPWEETKPTRFASRAAYAKQKRWLDVDRLYLFDAKCGQWHWYTKRRWQPTQRQCRATLAG